MHNISLFCVLLLYTAISALSLKITFIGPTTTSAPILAQASWEQEGGDPDNTSLQVVDISASSGPLVLQSFLLPASMKSASFEVELKSAGTFQLQGVLLQNSQAYVFTTSDTITVLQSGLLAMDSTILSTSSTISESQPTTLPTFTSTVLLGARSATVILNATPMTSALTSQSESAGTGADPKVIVGAVLGTALAFVGLMAAIYFIRHCHSLWVPGIYGQRKRPLFYQIIPWVFQWQVDWTSQSSTLPTINSGPGSNLEVIIQQEKDADCGHADSAVTISHLSQGTELTFNPVRTLGHNEQNHPGLVETLAPIREVDDPESTYIGSSVSQHASCNTDLMGKPARKQRPKVVNRSSVALSVLEGREHSWVLATKLAPVYVNRDLPPVPEQV
ncbi:hypothetical protein Moror_11547 [Moniliophthora roreri MCA 2997]|uniref:Mid2 domain-containing protein n=1 Tax=Moniliophthora roreri (strain MCA 2997) TaxID=1381753 RepID=V2WUV5_MONRO|nr:hypothetical protein Moror_11547 [Moniliophthora roreri MCA 2997]